MKLYGLTIETPAKLSTVLSIVTKTCSPKSKSASGLMVSTVSVPSSVSVQACWPLNMPITDADSDVILSSSIGWLKVTVMLVAGSI